jgi:hypothetical protein
MYELMEYGLIVAVAVISGGCSFLVVAAVLAVMEAVNARQRTLRAR